MTDSSFVRPRLAGRGASTAPGDAGVEPGTVGGESPGSPADARYLPDIDGLRAIAVLAVIFFHVGLRGFTGGYVGVDVFFVVSGFLITRLIRDQISLGKFSFSGFYLRRARRLFAALFFTLLVSFGAAFTLFSPEHFEQFGGSLLYVLLSISNFYFWGESGYFDTAAQFKPLLHTWSLSVEEQFYLVWPLTLFLLLKKTPRWLPPVFIVVAGVLSLFLGSRWLEADPSGAFYLAPFRVVEFAFGAILVWLIGRQPKHPVVREALVTCGLGLIVYAVVTFTPETSFPTLKALAPCLGAALIIHAGAARYSGLLLRNPLAVGIGLISYSLYLIHWPIIVFFGYLRTDLTDVERYAIVGVSLAAATLMYWFVEQPFRRGFRAATPSAFGFVCAMLALILSLPAAHAWANRGWPWRFGAVVAADFDLDMLRMNTLRYMNEHVSGVQFTSDRRKVLVVGDSHAGDVSNTLSMVLDPKVFEVRIQTLDDICLPLIATGEAPPDFKVNAFLTARCKEELASFRTSLKVSHADVVVFSAAFARRTAAAVRGGIEMTRRISQHGRDARVGLGAPQGAVDIVLMGRAPIFLNLQTKVLKRLSDGGSVAQINREAFSWQDREAAEINKVLASVAEAAGVTFVSKEAVVCPEQTCTVLSDAGELMLWDASHWTVEGERLFGERLLEAYPGIFD